jgi:predicted AlkP superfamily phosphohydrolase/phosphomutase
VAKRKLVPVATAIAALFATAALAEGPHVALISIDGLRPAEYLGGGPCGPAPPHLAALMRAGSYARGVEGVLPSLTYPSHATLVTGELPRLRMIDIAPTVAALLDIRLPRTEGSPLPLAER